MKKLLISLIGLLLVVGFSFTPVYAEKVVTLTSTQVDSVQFHIGKVTRDEGTEVDGDGNHIPVWVTRYLVQAVVNGTLYDENGIPVRQQTESTAIANLPAQVKTATTDLLKWFAKKYNNVTINLDADTLPDLE